jgi:hypothetical protein
VAVTKDFLNKAQKNIVEIALVDVSVTPNIILALPQAAGGVYQTGSENGEIEEISCLGVKVRGKVYPTVSKPAFQLNFGAKTPELIGLKLNRRFNAAGSTTQYLVRNKFKVPSTGTVAAAPVGTFGNGITADPAGAIGSYMTEYGVTDDLTYEDFATDITAMTTTFAIGANGALKFSDDLKNAQVSIKYPVASQTVRELGSTPYTQLEMFARVILLDGTMTTWYASDISIDSTGDISLEESTQQLTFFVNGNIAYTTHGTILSPC